MLTNDGQQTKQYDNSKKAEMFYCFKADNVQKQQLVIDNHILKIHDQSLQMKKFKLGYDEVFLKLDNVEFQRNNNFTANDLQKLLDDRQEYQKYLIRNSKAFLTKDFFKNTNRQKNVPSEDQTQKKVKLDELYGKGESQQDSNHSSSNIWDSDFGEKDFEASDDNQSDQGDRDDYD